MKPEDIRIGEIYWLRFPDYDPVFSYHGRFLITQKNGNLVQGKFLDDPHPPWELPEFFYWRLLTLENHAALVAMQNILMDINERLAAAELGVDTSVLQRGCSSLRSSIAKELKGNI